ncbi:hypothetical protein RCH09_003537 [Actimicrobium sp. GrIS 1.19]|uniref:DUF1579 domain-containing protein n=1 Tax=Actimicrobium sp. GrIS 1.19 TaxID=3071708 RepID=UPI002E037559|nr:hypothetical protein [Actimicrobium sp. GrIS 1.19]
MSDERIIFLEKGDNSMSSASDFDFFIGKWSVSHRRLKERLANGTEWDEFSGTTETRKILGGTGNCDENYLQLPGDAYHAITLRTFDPATAQWAIWWLDGRHPGNLDVPMRGQFVDGVGTFLTKDTFQGKPIMVRFLWQVKPDGTPRWEQAFSSDDGLNWETNWTMNFTKSA